METYSEIAFANPARTYQGPKNCVLTITGVSSTGVALLFTKFRLLFGYFKVFIGTRTIGVFHSTQLQGESVISLEGAFPVCLPPLVTLEGPRGRGRWGEGLAVCVSWYSCASASWYPACARLQGTSRCTTYRTAPTG